ncbi:MAG: hypothetical protein KF895_02960 [Parvibaculum sp.]|nr:hypothetical protein [Parvibaculum sp.]
MPSRWQRSRFRDSRFDGSRWGPRKGLWDSDGGRRWTPLSDPNVIHWWSGRYPALITTAGAQVSNLVDVKAGLALAQADSGAQPANSGIELIADGVDDRVFRDDIGSLPTGAITNGLEVWFRCRQDALAADTGARILFAYGTNGATVQFRIVRAVGGGVNRLRLTIGDGSTTVTNTLDTVDFSGAHIGRVRYQGGQMWCELGGARSAQTAVTPNIGNQRIRMFATAQTTATGFWHGRATDVICTLPTSDALAAQYYAFLATN